MPPRLPRLLPLLLAAALAASACSKEKPKESSEEEPEVVIADDGTFTPQFDVDRERAFSIAITETIEMASENRGAPPTETREFEMNLRLVPAERGVEFRFSNPNVETLPRQTPEEKNTYLLRKFDGMWSPSFLVSDEGEFAGVLNEDQIKAAYEAATTTRIEAASNPEQLRAIAASSDPVALMEEIGRRRWNEMAGIFLDRSYTLGKIVEIDGGRLSASERTDCTDAKERECVLFEADLDMAEGLPVTEEEMARMNAELIEARRQLAVVAPPETMVPRSATSRLVVSMRMAGRDGVRDVVTSTTTEIAVFTEK